MCAQVLHPSPRPLLSALLSSSYEYPAAPLEALRIQDLSQSLMVLGAFAGTLRHLMLPDLSWISAYNLSNVVRGLAALEVRDFLTPEL